MSSSPCLTLYKSRVADSVGAGSGVINAESCPLNAVCPYGDRASNGEALHAVRQGLQFSPDAVYVVRSGCIRISQRVGDLEWASFRFPGEPFGTQGLLDDGMKRVRAMATMDSQLCRLPRRLLLNRRQDNLQLTRSIIHACNLEQTLLQASLFRHRMHSDARVADFLLEMHRRLPERGVDRTPLVKLRMSRSDIACHLGMAQETVSRVLKRLADARVIGVKGRGIALLDMAELRDLSVSGKEYVSRL
ncbi:Crp/Fnr family transcriptional regulator [Sedimenticola selenatireducens]|uniref:Crp/Fnr family transcriptional regulator n=1 Tax=Sedimenticola selenatireducens TaxID=191960 RepID=UPI0004916C93|nr:Crp/Fnr family transcriptional regulator [Sedimenticola selenatireducens]